MNKKKNLKQSINTNTQTPGRRHWLRSVVFIVNFERISHLFLFLLLNLSVHSFAELIFVFFFCEREYFQNTFKNLICNVFICFMNKVELTKFWEFFWKKSFTENCLKMSEISMFLQTLSTKKLQYHRINSLGFIQKRLWHKKPMAFFGFFKCFHYSCGVKHLGKYLLKENSCFLAFTVSVS